VLWYGAAAVATALLHARGRFVAAAFAPALANLHEIALFVQVHRTATSSTLEAAAHDHALVDLLGAGTTAAVAVVAVVLLAALAVAGVRLRPRFSWRHPSVRAVVRRSGWTLGYVAANEAALLVTLVLANATPGGVAAYQGAFTFFQLPHGLVAVSLMTTATPELARFALRADVAGFRARFATGLRQLGFLVLPAAAGYVVLGGPIIATLLQHGALSADDAGRTGAVLAAFALGLPAFSAYLYCLRGFYALGDTRTPFLVNVLENAANVAFALLLAPAHGVVGLALAYAGAYVVGAATAFGLLHRRLGRLEGRRTAGALGRAFAAALAMAVAVAGVRRVLGGDDPLVVTAGGMATGVVVFGVASYLARVPEALALVRRLRPLVA
jgi:putative peptidoglycan lipid II flippase